MHTVNIHEAKTHLFRLIDQIQQGEEIVIAKTGIPVARLLPYKPKRPHIKPPGGMKDEGFWIADDFDGPLPADLMAAFEGRDE